MGKKKNNKGKVWEGYYDQAFGRTSGATNRNSDKKGKNGKKSDSESVYSKPKTKKVRPTLDGKEVKQNRKLLQMPVEIPKEFRKNREKCNHVGSYLTVEEYKALTPLYAAYTPMLDQIIDVFGSSSVRICSLCYDVLVKPDEITAADIEKATTLLYASANKLVSHKKMDSSEVKDISKLKEALDDWMHLIPSLVKIESEETIDTESVDPNHMDSSLAHKLNRIAETGPTIM